MVVVFDIDDTLFREFDFVESSFNIIAKAIANTGLLTAMQVNKILHDAASISEGFDTLEAVLAQFNRDNYFTAKWMVNMYRTHMPSISLRVGAKQLLDKLQKKKINIAIITDGRIVTQENKIKALGLHRWVSPENVIISEAIGADKTTAFPFLALAQLFPHEKSFVYVADNPSKDFYWPNMLGWESVQILNPTGYGVHQHRGRLAAGYAPKHKVHTLAQISPILGL